MSILLSVVQPVDMVRAQQLWDLYSMMRRVHAAARLSGHLSDADDAAFDAECVAVHKQFMREMQC